MKLEQYGYRSKDPLSSADGIPARVTAVHRDRFDIICAAGSGLACLKTAQYRPGGELWPTTGDFVLLDWQPNGESRILKTLPRSTYFSRLDPSSAGHGEQAVAANFDHVFILQSLDRDFNPRRLERYLTLAWQSGAMPVVVLTKADGAEQVENYVRAAESVAVGVGVHAVSAKTGRGLETLGAYLVPGNTIVLLGSSGVGKSTLVNALAGENVMATNSVRAGDNRGRHTTTHRQLLLLPSGVMVIDTPGMRELGMWDADEGLERSFADVEQYFGQCKFSDCHHRSEPGCAVTAAIRSGELSRERWESYLRLQTETRYSSDKEAYLREKKQWHKDISKQIKQLQATQPKQMQTPQLRQMQTPDYRNEPCKESFSCAVCGALVTPENAGTRHRNHCPHCLSSVHVDNKPGDRASLCRGVMEPIGIWVRNGGEWAVIHRCRTCGALSSNRVAADDSTERLLALAGKPLENPPFPLPHQDVAENKK